MTMTMPSPAAKKKGTGKATIILFFPDTGEGLDRITPPLGLMSLKAVLERDGWPVAMIDSRIEANAERKVFDLIHEGALMIGMGPQTGPQIGTALDISRKVKKTNPDFPVVWGGWHASILPDQTIAEKVIDVVVKGQGELTILELADCLANGGDLEKVAGLVLKKDGKPVHTAPRNMVDLDEFPPLPFHQIDLKKYPGRKSDKKEVFVTYRSSQGCPWRCDYCADPLVFNRRWKSLSAERTIDELETLQKKHGVTEVLFVDDTFVISKKRIRAICEGIIERGLKIKWQACARTGMIASMDQEDVDLMAKAGCTQIHPGVEASNQEMLNAILKDEKHENTMKCAEKLARAGIRGLYSFMVCFPGENKTAIRDTFRIIRKLKEVDANNIMPVNFYVPYPGNGLYERSKEYGFKPPRSLEEWKDFNTRKGNATPWITDSQIDEVLKKDKYYLAAAYPSAQLKMKMEKGQLSLLYRALHKIARFRVKNDWYDLDLDWQLLLAYWKFWEKNNRKMKLHNIHFR